MRELPPGWARTRVGDAFDMQLGKMLSKDAAAGPSQREYLTNKNVQWNRLGFDELNYMSFSESEREKFRLIHGDLLVTEGGEVGRTAIWEEQRAECYFQKSLHRLRTRGAIEPRYMLHYMAYAARHGLFVDGVSQTSIAHLPQDKFAEHLVAHPVELGEQRRIVEVIDAVSEQERSIQAGISKMWQVRGGLLDHAFHERANACTASTDGVTGNGCDGWPHIAIGDLCDVASGATPSRAAGSRYFTDVGTPWVKTLDLNEGPISVTGEALTEVAMSELRMRLFPARSVLVAMYGGWEQIGRTSILEVPAAVNQAISVLEARADLDPDYLLLALQHGRHQWSRFAASTRKDPNITKSDVLGFKIPVPPREEQARIVALAAAPLREIAADEEALTKMRKLKQGLVGRLLAGAA
ncbi:restriction endonuclease subunit S [Streptomyces sp. NRRL S-1813]|uniref:restriction endonuclease subunit S n=1 Tax=Streptomyces sp. NRRL S-1813 TaxID=1463888 RepID=UPI00068D0F2B|nr:restriction endonuclease subunit S [Streptomyces sp. NRRL S-1813]